jgi:transcriptional regulator with XRE-family HTH domain
MLPLWSWPGWFGSRIIARVESLAERFGSNVRNARRELGWTQEDLSARTGLAVVQVSRIERGKREIRLSTLVRLLESLGKSPDDLLAGLWTAKP